MASTDFRYHRGQPLPSAALMSPMTRSFVATLEDFAAQHGMTCESRIGAKPAK
jgi:hypothetical protein